MAGTSKITPNVQVDRLIALGTSPAGPIYLYAVKLGARVETRAKRNLSGSMVKVRTGNLRSSGHTTTEVRGSTLVESVIFDAEYAVAVHNGAEAHDIVPRQARVLAWQSTAGKQFATRVHQPKRAGKPFLVEALAEVKSP